MKNEELKNLLETYSFSEVLDMISGIYLDMEEKTPARYAQKFAKDFRDNYLNK